MSDAKLSAAVVGCKGIGPWHARSIDASEEMRLVAICDLDAERAKEEAAKFPDVRAYSDFAALLAEERPEIVTVATPTASHAALTIQAAEAGVRGICCEKPMAISMGEARAMMDACRRNGVQLTVNHQRRTGEDLLRMRELITSGAIGEVTLLRGSCQGDLLSDGTHLIDSLLFFAGDPEIAWAFAGLYRREPDPSETRGAGYHASGGYRYGHAIESGGMGTWEFQTGLRAEIFWGELRLPGRKYQDYEVLGTKGRLWRTGDEGPENLFIQTSGTDGWQLVPVEGDRRAILTRNYDLLARNVRSGTGAHPLSGENSYRGFEVLMALYESARTRTRVELPLTQEQFPLALMLAESG